MRTYKHKWEEHESYYINSDYGFCKVVVDDEPEQKIATLYDLIVYPEYRKNGHGQEILNEAIRCATMEDCDILVCYPDCELWTMGWFKRNGFILDETIEREFGYCEFVMKLK